MSRKYRQRGYMDYEHGSEKRRSMSDESPFRPEPQRITVRVIKCYRCGNEIKDAAKITFESTCGKCGSDLRMCVNCSFFDPSSHFQCMKEVTTNISPKDKRNNCPSFNPRSSVEKRFINVESQLDARKAFENLFKK
ncbi:hypothetical protein ACFL27_20880 [candidate division CSSED10-310 bacterium]|uniref:Uncharacterized protein n=1 Tax=candidate division CSSED10-310 bacterium TaxID=2855610 RepID=A0ABV6Z2T8_UNCC1